MPSRRLYDNVADMEPLLPEDRDGKLAALALDLIRQSERLRGVLHPITGQAVAALVRSMNSYYSNLIEGHRTTPRDIDAALTGNFSRNPQRLALQRLHLAHIETQREMESRFGTISAGDICTEEFLRHVHGEFYRRIPEEFRRVEDADGRPHAVIPGDLRTSEVSVGLHLAPDSRRLPLFLKRFAEFYAPLVKPDPQGLIAAAAAHHRLAWIHPFLDGNGRVTRLFTQAWLLRAGAGGDGWWTLSRGFARRQEDYKACLSNADERRLNDFDGRGHLSDRRLAEFCEFALRTGLDQLAFMRELLGLDLLQRRIIAFAEREEAIDRLPKGSALVLREVFLRGEIPRGEVARIVGVSPRTAQGVTRGLIGRRLLASDSAKGLLRLGFPSDAAENYFPGLYPAGTD